MPKKAYNLTLLYIVKQKNTFQRNLFIINFNYNINYILKMLIYYEIVF